MSKDQNNAKIVTTCGQRITALQKLVTTKSAMKINGKPMKLSEVVAIYQANIDSRAELIAQRAKLDAVLAVRESAEVTRRATDAALRAWVIAEFGAESTEAQEFGFGPRKVTAASAETKALAVEKLRATRKARHTLGKKEKLKIKGDINAPATSAAPAANASSPTSSAPTSAPATGATESH